MPNSPSGNCSDGSIFNKPRSRSISGLAFAGLTQFFNSSQVVFPAVTYF